MPLTFQVLFALLSDLGAELLPHLRHLFPDLLDDVDGGLFLVVVNLGLVEDVEIIDSLLQFLYLAFPVECQDLLPAQLFLHHQAFLVPSNYLELLLLYSLIQRLHSLLVVHFEHSFALLDFNELLE